MPNPLLDGPADARIAAFANLIERGTAPKEHELDALCAALGDVSKAVQRRAAEALATFAERGVRLGDRLQASLDAADLRRRWGAAYALSRIGPLSLTALPTLLEVLNSDDGDLRWAAADLLKQLAERHRDDVVDRLLAGAGASGNQRKMAFYCLRDLGVAAGFDAAIAGLAEGDIESRLAALAFIAKVHPSAAVAAPHIVAMVEDADPRMQRAAAGTLGGLGVSAGEVIDALRRAAASPDPSLRRAAERSLRLLRP
jgi:HEAT repeat protein